MTTHVGNIVLKTPSLAEGSKLDFDARSFKAEQWVTELPLTNAGETARLIFNILVKLNCHTVPIKNRIKILEVFRPTIGCLLKATRKHFFGSNIPISEKNRAVAHLACALQEEMANGYKIVIMNSLNQKNSHPDPKVQTMIAHRALYYLSGILLTSYQTYMSPPKGVWRDTHQVFCYAEQFNLLHNTINDAENDLTPWSSILDTYKQIALFALADPYHLSQHEMEKLRTTLYSWASTCQLKRYSENQPDTILIKPYDDQPPFKKIQQSEQKTLQDFSLDTAGALHEIKRRLSQLNEKKATQQKYQGHLTPSLLSHLSKAWNPATKRCSTRKNRETTLNGAFGLDAVHHFVNRDKNSFASDIDKSTPNSLFHSTRFTVSDGTPKEMNDLDTINIWELSYSQPIDTEFKDDESFYTDINQSPEVIQNHNLTYCTDRFIVMNESAGGLCVQLPKEKPSIVRIGELLCLQNALEQTNCWEIGVIRWIKNTTAQTIEMGIQLLSPSAEAVALSTYFDINNEPKIKKKDYVRGLLLPEIKALKQPRSLLTMINCYQLGSVVNLLENNIEKRYTLLTTIEDTYGYNRFEVTPYVS